MVDMTDVPSIDINDYQVILIVNDQVQSFYDNYANNYNKFESYVQNGGTLVFFACDHGWADGDNYTDLPGGVEVGDRIILTNIIANTSHHIVTQELTNHPDAPLTNSDMDSFYSSHNYFIESTLPAGADILFRTDDADQFPTLVVYNLGAGTVIASGLTWEYTYDRYVGPSQQFGFGRALPDVFKYAFSIAGGHKTSGVNVDIYPEDYWLAQRQEVYKAKEDLLDIVACITNNTNPNTEQPDVSLTLTIDNTKIDTSFLKVYKRASAEEIAIVKPVKLNEGSQPGEYSVIDNNGIWEITINGLTIPPKSLQQWNDFVFRFKVADDVANGQTLDAEATVFGDNIEMVSEKLSVGGATVTVISRGKIVLTNRELMYRQFAQTNGIMNDNGASQVNQLWQTLYKIASERRAVVYHIDKYDRDDDGDAANNITIDWFDDRQHLANNDGGGHYHYDVTTTTNDEEATINQVATKIKGLLNDFITQSGGVGNGRYVAILGGDAIIPFYRVFDPSNTVSKYEWAHDATAVTETDADNNYLFSDIYFRDFNGIDWGEGTVENIFIGRVLGTNAQNIERLLISSNDETSTSDNVIKLENNHRDCLLDNYDTLSTDNGYTVIDDIDGVNINVANPNGCFPSATKGTSDPARWSNFNDLFAGNANNITDFDVMRNKSHGSVGGISGSESGDTYYTATNLFDNRNTIRDHLSSFRPFFIFDSCLNGLVDGSDNDQITRGLLNTLLPLGIRGAVGFSGVSQSPLNSRLLDTFYEDEEFLTGVAAGEALVRANRTWGGNGDADTYQRFALNLFGLPWAAITSPDDRAAAAAIQAYNEKNENSTIQSIILGTNTKTTAVDASNYSQTASDGYDLININGFDLLLQDSVTPVVPTGRFSANVPLNATIDSVTVDFSTPVDLGALNIPAFQPPPPMPDPDGLLPPGGYVDSPTNLGVFPASQYSYKTAEIIGYKQVLVDIYPLTFDTGSGQTTLYSSANINVTYTTPDQGLVQSFTSDKRTYAVAESIVTTANIENISASANSFTVTVNVLDLTDKVISTNSTSQSIASSTTDAVTVNLTAPATGGSFRLSMTASDGTNTIGSSQQEINAVEGQIVSFAAPTSIDGGSYGDFSIEFENLSQEEITAYEDIAIHNSSGEMIAKLPQIVEVIGAGSTSTTTSQWFPPSSLPSGTYTAYVNVTVNTETYTMKSNSFDIIYQNDISLLQGWNLISLNLLPADTAIDSVLSGISGKYSAVWAYIDGSWQVYDMFNPGFSDLATMESGYGYWIYMNNSGVLAVGGTSPASDLLLDGGWNLVGFNSSSSMAITDALATIAGKYISVWTFINGSWQVYDPANPEFSDLTTMEPGYGYWINATEFCTWTLP